MFGLADLHDCVGMVVHLMTDNLRDRIAAVLNANLPVMEYLRPGDTERAADAVIRELEPELNRHDTGCVCDDCWPDQEGD